VEVGNYNTLAASRHLKHNYEQLQSSVQDTNQQRLNSCSPLATEVAMTYGFMHSVRVLRFAHCSAGRMRVRSVYGTVLIFWKDLTSAALPTGGLRLLAVPGLSDDLATPTLWPVIGI